MIEIFGITILWSKLVATILGFFLGAVCSCGMMDSIQNNKYISAVTFFLVPFGGGLFTKLEILQIIESQNLYAFWLGSIVLMSLPLCYVYPRKLIAFIRDDPFTPPEPQHFSRPSSM